MDGQNKGEGILTSTKQPKARDQRLWITCKSEDDASSLTVPKFVSEVDVKAKKNSKSGSSEDFSEGIMESQMRESLAETESGLTMNKPIEYGEFVGRGLFAGLVYGFGRAISSVFRSSPRNYHVESQSEVLPEPVSESEHTSEVAAPVVDYSAPRWQIKMATSP